MKMTVLKSISPERAAELFRDGAVLVDIREADEHAREKIPGARHHAISRIDTEHPIGPQDDLVIFHCRTGARTQTNAPRLAPADPACVAYVLEGGLDAWKKAGLPVALNRHQPIEINRQVQIAAGGLVLLGLVLGAFVTPALYFISAFVGAGLVFAGVTGFCGMAKIFAAMPWNNAPAAAAH
jgi:rhodanese-related sulfurtransferase